MYPDSFEEGSPLLSLAKPLTESQARMYSPLTLAFTGDAVYSLLVRELLTMRENKPTGKLHRESIDYVNAAFQAKAIKELLPILDENETAIFKRGRNAHSAHSPKNQSDADYRYATALEAVFGYLYLCGKNERLAELFKLISVHILNPSTDTENK